VEVGASWAGALQRLVTLAAELDRSGEWNLDGSPTAAHWIASALDVEVCTAREWVRVGRALPDLPVLAGRFEQGSLSFSKVRALTRVATPEHEADLCQLADRVSAGDLPRALAKWRAERESPDDTERRQRRDRSLTTWVDHDGMVCGHFRLPPLEGGVLTAAVDAEVTRRSLMPREESDATAVAPEPRATLAQQRADALVEVIGRGGASPRTEIVLHVRGDGCTMDDGTPVPDGVIEQVASEAFIRALIHDADRRPINASGAHRHHTTRQKRVIKERDRVCVDCGSRQLLEYDHEPDFETSQRTLVEESKLRCAPCHRRRHAEA
jgi:hypothetical protein